MPFYLKQLMKRGGYMDPAADETGAGKSAGGNASESGEKAGDDKAGKSGAGGLSDKEADLLREVMDKKAKLKEAQDQLTQVNARLKDFDGIDPNAVRSLLQEQKDRAAKELEAKGEWETLKKQMQEAHQSELAAAIQHAAEASSSTAQLRSKIAELTVGHSFANSRFLTTSSDLPPSKMRVFFGSHFEFDGAQVVGYDKPAGAAGRAPLVDGSGAPLSFEVAIEKLVRADPDAANLLKGEIKPGARSSSEKTVIAPQVNSNLRGVSRIAAALALQKKSK